MTSAYLFDGEGLRALEAPGSRPMRWAAWRPDGAYALLAGNRGEAWRFDGRTFAPLATGSAHNLRGAAWSPDGALALLVGNRGAAMLYDGSRFVELAPASTENLRRAAWSPDGTSALIIGNGGCVLRFDASTRALQPVPGDRAHTLRSIAWRPDGAYALIGAYASRFAGYPRPHVLYRCDGRYAQALLATDDEDDAVAIAWRPGSAPPRALALIVAYGEGAAVRSKIIEFDGAGFSTRTDGLPQRALLGADWRPGGAYALLCGEAGALLRYDGEDIAALRSGTDDNLVGPFWRPDGTSALVLRGPAERVYTV